jgi:hypothetical protein
MEPLPLDQVVRNVDERLEHVEQILPTLVTKQELREESEQTRRHFDIVAESLRSDIRLLAEGQAALHQRVGDLRTELRADIASLDRRVMRLEAHQ